MPNSIRKCMRNDNWCKFRDMRFGNSKYRYRLDEFGDGHRFPMNQPKNKKYITHTNYL